MAPGELESSLDGLGAAVGEKDPLGFIPGRQGCQPLSQAHLGSVIEVGSGHVDQPLRLLADRGHDEGVRMTDIRDCDPRREVEEAIAVHVLDHRAFGPPDDQRINPGIGRRRDPLVARAIARSAARAEFPKSAVRHGKVESFQFLPQGLAAASLPPYSR